MSAIHVFGSMARRIGLAAASLRLVRQTGFANDQCFPDDNKDGDSFLESRDAMGEGFRSRFAEFSDTTYVRTAQTVKVAESGLLAFESGDWQGSWTTPAGPLRTGGSYAASWSKASGAWKIRSEVFVTLFCNGSGCS